MKLSILSTLVLPFLAAAGPSGYQILSSRSASPVHLLPMNANGGAFYLGGNTSTYCPPQVGSCPPGTQTVLAPGGAALDVTVPGGQELYISPTGALSFTQPHSAYVPPGSVLGPFSIAARSGSTLPHYSTTAWGASGFMACPTKDHRWQVFVAAQNVTAPLGKVEDCLGFSAIAFPYNGSIPAWEYV
ncbi:hypothetical protein MPDQ_004900 [Monascus purpureus]|uniref:IgE-binding protein n=1 Tax=Monascus purpureus TaxID=5098 RepID=A0A507QXB1_MONPU|nr:hypothetical protein MPDQ_004900 [Monascus purpureus]BDD55827.1 hypothetical protein MAP00_001311 [Monascus purpureus]